MGEVLSHFIISVHSSHLSKSFTSVLLFQASANQTPCLPDSWYVQEDYAVPVCYYTAEVKKPAMV